MKPFIVHKANGVMRKDSKGVFREQWNALPDGSHLISIEPAKAKKYTPTRYKYYFDCVLGLALKKAAPRFSFVNTHGEMRNPATVEELHFCLKLTYNPVQVLDAKSGMIKTIGHTTTGMSDREFIYEFTEMIIAEFTGPPYDAYSDTGCPLYEEWKEMHKTKTWKNYKGAYV